MEVDEEIEVGRVWSQWKSTKDIKAGELVIFCAACPLPGVNLPPDWKDDVNKYVLSVPICHPGPSLSTMS